MNIPTQAKSGLEWATRRKGIDTGNSRSPRQAPILESALCRTAVDLRIPGSVFARRNGIDFGMARPERFELPTFWFVARRRKFYPMDLISLTSFEDAFIGPRGPTMNDGRIT